MLVNYINSPSQKSLNLSFLNERHFWLWSSAIVFVQFKIRDPEVLRANSYSSASKIGSYSVSVIPLVSLR